MLSDSAFKRGLSVIFSVHPQLEPGNNKELIYKAWFSMFKDLEDKDFLNAISRFLLEKPKLYPGDNFIALIRQVARPTLTETEGDVIELAFQAARDFGYMREKDALDWLKKKSPLVAAAVRRFGYLDICKSENSDVIRGQLRAIFKAEKERSRQAGGIVESAAHLKSGLPDSEKLIGLTEKIGKGKLKALPGGKKNAA